MPSTAFSYFRAHTNSAHIAIFDPHDQGRARADVCARGPVGALVDERRTREHDIASYYH